MPEQEVTAVIQARLSSARLPGKVLLPFGNKTILESLINRLRQSKSVGRIIVATSDQPSDDKLVSFISQRKIAEVFRGSLHNVFSRYQTLASELHTKFILRITADCPLVCPDLIDSLVTKSILGNWDLLSNSHADGIIKGFDLEIFTRDLIASIKSNNLTPHEQEHVTPSMYKLEQGRILLINYPNLYRYRELNFSVDTLDDYNFLNRIENKFGVSKMTFEDIFHKIITKL